ncbi:MAG: helix-turn-helix domain-containing protein [Bacteroidia bacterium]
MRAKRYIELSPSEVITLEEGYKNVKHHQFKSRCHCLLLSNQGYDMATLKSIFQVTHPTITNWFDGWEKQGIVGLWNKSGQGRKFILTEADKPLIKSKVQSSPQQLKKVRLELKEELNKEFSTKTLQRFLKSLVKQIGDVGEKV